MRVFNKGDIVRLKGSKPDYRVAQINENGSMYIQSTKCSDCRGTKWFENSEELVKRLVK